MLSQMRSKQVWARISIEREFGESLEEEDRDSFSKRDGCPSHTARMNGWRMVRR